MRPLFELIVLFAGLGGFGTALVVQFRLRRYVSADRVRELLDRPSELYPNGIPPRAVLNEHGQRLHRLMMVGISTFMGAIIVLMFSKGF